MVTPATIAAPVRVSVMVPGPTHWPGATAGQVRVRTFPAAATVTAGVKPVAVGADTVVPAGPVTVMVVAPAANATPAGTVIVQTAVLAAVGAQLFVEVPGKVATAAAIVAAGSGVTAPPAGRKV
jgi:hypothetical protein